MQNFLAIALFVVLIGVVFWPEEIFKSHPQNSAFRSTVREVEKATGKRSNPTAAGFVHHYLGIEEKEND